MLQLPELHARYATALDNLYLCAAPQLSDKHQICRVGQRMPSEPTLDSGFSSAIAKLAFDGQSLP